MAYFGTKKYVFYIIYYLKAETGWSVPGKALNSKTQSRPAGKVENSGSIRERDKHKSAIFL